jgi:small-conductance mechanosensitive channel
MSELTPAQLEVIVGSGWIVLAAAVGLAMQRVLYWTLRRWAKARHNTFADAIVRQTGRPAAYILPLLAILIVVPDLVLPERWIESIEHVTGLLAIGAVAWSIIALIGLWRDITVAGHRLDVEDNLVARQLGTRVDILSRIASTLVGIVAVGMILMTFPEIRALGTTLLASAGVAGIVAGLAARPLFENLIAGIQLALTQPIRIDDVVIVEKQYGRIEEIHSTYVVVRLWDLRRLVVPLTYFIETPFENWTRRTANLMGEVYFFADFTLDIDALRAQIPEMIRSTPLWDGQFQNLQVTDATDRALQLRVLVTARNSSELFDLRCFMRERIATYLRDRQPHALPRVRSGAPSDSEDAETQRAAQAAAAGEPEHAAHDANESAAR